MQFATANGTVTFESLWRTREDNLVPINEMDDEHLLNTMGFIQRNETERERGTVLPFCELPNSQHNIEVLAHELLRRAE